MSTSIIIDTYQQEDFIAAAIESALGQTVACQVIVVDDGSTDGTLDVVSRYRTDVEIVSKTNGGQASALNAGAARARGDHVIFLDGDDVLDIDVVARVRRTMDAHPGSARVQWPLRIIDRDGRATGEVTPRADMMPNGDLRDHVLRYRTHVWPAQSGNAYSMAALAKVLPVPEHFRLGCDLYLAESTALMGAVWSLPTPGGSYRYHDRNLWTNGQLDVAALRQKIAWTVASHEELRRLCEREGIECPADPRAARDVAFACVRIASLRLDRSSHPFDESRLSLYADGVLAALAHPHHSARHKAKRLAWLTGMALGNRAATERLVRRFYFRR